MKVTIESTSKIVELNGVPARVWEGTTDSGIKVHCFVTRIAIDKDETRMYFEKVSIENELPQIGKFVTTIDEANEQRVYRLVQVEPIGLSWNMRDADGINSPNNNLKITHWLKEVDLREIFAYADSYAQLERKVEACYVDENGEEIEDDDIDLGTIGEIAATHFGFL
jgi:hypothetical protein